MRKTLTLDFDEYEQADLRVCLQPGDIASAIKDFDFYLRTQIKHGEDLSKIEYAEEIRERLRECFASYECEWIF